MSAGLRVSCCPKPRLLTGTSLSSLLIQPTQNIRLRHLILRRATEVTMISRLTHRLLVRAKEDTTVVNIQLTKAPPLRLPISNTVLLLRTTMMPMTIQSRPRPAVTGGETNLLAAKGDYLGGPVSFWCRRGGTCIKGIELCCSQLEETVSRRS